jgi:hypothetical protein
MGRLVMYLTIVLLAVFVATSYGLMEHGGGSISANRDVQIANLGPAHDGTDIVTEGELSYSWEHRRYQVVDAGEALIISSYHDEQALNELRGVRVQVSGTFHTGGELGYHIDANAVLPVESPESGS